MPGKYRVKVHKEGFREVILDQLVLNVQDVVDQNFKLDVGSLSESVTVQANGININIENASVSTVVDQTYVQNMPLNGRSFQDLVLLTPGVVTQSPQKSDSLRGRTGEFSVKGQRRE